VFLNGNLNFNGNYVAANDFSFYVGFGASSGDELNIAYSTIDLYYRWEYSKDKVLDAASTEGSLIRMYHNGLYTKHSDDTYCVIEAPAVDGGTFQKITMKLSEWNCEYRLAEEHDIITDTLLFMEPTTTNTCGNYTCNMGEYKDYGEDCTITINSHFANIGFTSGGSMTNCYGSGKLILKNRSQASARIEMGASSTVDLNNMDVDYVHINGPGIPYSVSGGADIGTPPSTGWEFTGSSSSNRLYWVGGYGNWNYPGHWSFQSGGAPNTCNRIPSAETTVVFDENSGLDGGRVDISQGDNVECDSMIWTNILSPALFFDSYSRLTVHGSLQLLPTMTISKYSEDYGIALYFSSHRAKETVMTYGVNIPMPVYLVGTGTWTLGDQLILTDGTTDYNLYFSGGNIDLSGAYLKCRDFINLNIIYYIDYTSGKLNISDAIIDVFSWQYINNDIADRKSVV
jgi:hypothetical protein